MNIFVLDLDHKINVQYYIDKHVVKQITEAAQMLCTARKLVGDGGGKYKITHANHPCNVWVRQSKANYQYLCELGVAIGHEYTHRYNKKHKSLAVIYDCYNHIPDICGEFTLPPSCMKEEFIVGDNVVENYRNYYRLGKRVDKRGRSMLKWTNRTVPEWFGNIN